ncbi:MAG: trigger factor [Sphingomonadales bacterium]
MQVTQTSSEGLKRDYKIVVGAESIEEKLNERLQTLGKNARMAGFRPGKVPVSLLKKLHGKNLMGEVLEETVSETSRKVLQDNDERAAFQPKIEIVRFEEGSDLEYEMKVEILPTFEIGDFNTLELERLTAPAGDAEVQEFVENIAREQKNFKAAAKTYKAKNGDAVLMNFIGRRNGEAFEGGSGADFLLELGSGLFIPGFEEQLIGVKAGDNVTVAAEFPGDYSSAELAGQKAEFEVEVKEVQKPHAVDIDDELAKRLGMENLEDLKKAAHDQVVQEHARASRMRLKRSLLDALAEQYDFVVPQGMLDIEFDMIWNELMRDLERHGEDLASLGKTEDEARDEYRAIAERRVRLGLLLSEIGRANNIDVRQDELNRMIVEEARRHPGQEKQVLEYYKNNANALAQMRAPLLEEKVVDFILEMAKVTERDVTHEELMRDPDEETEAGKKPAKKKASAPKKAAAKKPAAKKTTAKKAATKKADEKLPAARKPAARKSAAKGKVKAKAE